MDGIYDHGCASAWNLSDTYVSVVNAHTGMVNSMDYIKYLKDYDSLLAMGVLFATPVPAVIYEKIKRGMLGTLAIAVIFALSMYYLAVSANNPFLYFNF